MKVYDAAIGRRTIRKFKQDKISKTLLENFVNAARLAPSGANMQPLKYIIVNSDEKAETMFKHVKWAAYISPEGTPREGEKPVAYIIILADTEIKKAGYELDIGAAAGNIFLCAWEEGIGTCWMGAIDRDGIRRDFKIPEKYVINTVIALGYAGEEPVVDNENGSVKYYKDENGTLHVPKRRLSEVIVNIE